MKILKGILAILSAISLFFLIKGLYFVITTQGGNIDSLKWTLRGFLYLPNYYVHIFRIVKSDPQKLISMATGNISFAVHFFIPILTFILGLKLKRSAFVWALGVSYIPALALLLCLKEEKQNIPVGASSATTSGSTSYSSKKSCSACGREVSLLASAGQRCPHCGAYWSSENKTYQ